MRILVVARRVGRGEGAPGYAAGLVGGLRERGHDVAVAGTGVLGVRAGDRVLVALDRVADADVWRAGGGVHRLAWSAVGRRAPRLEAWREARAAATARFVVANSRMVADQLLQAHGVPPCRIEVVRTGVDLGRFQPGTRDEGPRIVLFAAHGWRRKGFETAVAAFLRGASRRDRLWVAGRDARRSRWLARARGVLGERVVDLGERADLASVLPRVHAVLHPTRYDAAANLVLEGLACGAPVVTTWMDGSAEIVPDPRLVARDPTDVAAVAGCLQRALASADPAPFRAAAMAWPGSRNHEAMEAIASRCT
ncbi:MAG: glycosyltransferase family 4 protein [Alphaproteobacteria bacterium]|nr:glycosyltransferase family 4 protein [Alphaproteobacteria bacterium]